MKAPVIAGKYTLLRKLGAGGMAEVFLAKQASEGNFEKLVVIKRILPALAAGASNNDFVAMFLDEARLASDLRHPNIVTVIDVGKTSDTYYIVMEFLHGQDVRKVQRKNAAWQEQIPLGHCCQIAIDAASGLHYAHHKADLSGQPLAIVHRDVSPQNILITYEGSTKIVDFGIAKAATQSTHTTVGVLKGKYTYMSPEQAQGDLVDARTDQFALGIVLWELLTMRRLFKRETEVLTLEAIINGQIPRVSRFREDIPKSIDDIVAKALSKDRNARFASCEQLALSLEDALSAEGVVHSQSRLSQYMRRLFADTLAEEATLGLVNPDGSLSRNLTPFTLPPQPANDAGAFEKIAEKPAAPPIDATTADRKIARSKAESSKDETSSKKKHVDSAAEKKIEPAPSPTSKASASNTEPTVVEEPRRKPRAPSPDTPETPKPKERSRSTPRSPPRAEPRARPRAAIYIAGVAGAVALFVASAAGYAAYATSGPATLVVRSEPHGASVSIDGKSTGQVTPALLRDVDAGTPHRIHIELAGKQSDEVVTIPKRGATLEIKLELR